MQFYQVRVESLGNHGIIHFLLQEGSGRSIEQSSFDVLNANFLSSRFDSPLHELSNRAELKEVDEQTFIRTKGGRIPSGEVEGMTFWWMK